MSCQGGIIKIKLMPSQDEDLEKNSYVRDSVIVELYADSDSDQYEVICNIGNSESGISRDRNKHENILVSSKRPSV
jgi:hypothetical protein